MEWDGYRRGAGLRVCGALLTIPPHGEGVGLTHPHRPIPQDRNSAQGNPPALSSACILYACHGGDVIYSVTVGGQDGAATWEDSLVASYKAERTHHTI